ncbi:tryptophan synthase beta subunit-like PLP-dependent enzyme [Myriangium duriaei CBS 260.36]|uniref:Tryptophan synthase beta subunit-like PLP-dependent enzyme n=1 Tax=Myriangium duriaei CBS 260.36 TaxID=1168546 RepID=A0A9P4J5D0_9PEZI|nr:tryptophan synthase beta subunit-like PLP-dependent enzyme [Myriangium duriaei CBS 260.36]
MASRRRPAYFNHKHCRPTTIPATDDAYHFHQKLPRYKPTPLIKLEPDVAKSLGVGQIYLKDESSRLGLPSFKILGASWGTFRAIASRFDIPLDADIERVNESISEPVTLYAATDGNHGRAVARMGALYDLPVEIHVPVGMYPATIQLIRAEGAKVVESTGNYDYAVLEAQRAAEGSNGILVQDFAFAGYEDIPRWIVDGYQTMMREIDEQLGEVQVDLVICPVGVGSFAQAVVSHFKHPDRSTAVMTVEPDTAACLWRSLTCGSPTTINTIPTIMAGMDCGTVSTIAWPLLQTVDVSTTVSDYEAHTTCLELAKMGLAVGPCGAAPLAALRSLSANEKERLGLSSTSVVVLLCTEGARDYDTPLDATTTDVDNLTKILMQAHGPSDSKSGFTFLARYIAAWLEHRNLDYEWTEKTKGRPSIAVVGHPSGNKHNLLVDGQVSITSLMQPDNQSLTNGGDGSNSLEVRMHLMATTLVALISPDP